MTLGITTISVLALSVIVVAAIGSLLDTVGLPGNPAVSVGGTFDGTYYMTTGASDNQIDIYLPPAPDAAPGLPPDPATLISSKTVLDAADGVTPVVISALAWDPSRSKLWGAYGDKMWLIAIGDPTVSGNVLATFQFSPSAQAPGEVGPHPSGLPGFYLVDGLAYDGNDDSIWYSPDVHNNVYHFASDGTYVGKVTPKDANGLADGYVSGVAVGSGNTLYIGRNGFAEIRRIDKTTGDFISTFATTAGRVEDLTCDPVTYAPKEAILAKDAYNGLYEAFEVEEGTCPLPDVTPPELECIETVNPHGMKVPPAGSSTLPGPKGGQNEDGFYELLGRDDVDETVEIFVTDTTGAGPFGPFDSGDKVKITEAPGATPSSKKIGSSNGKAGAIAAHITLNSDAIVVAVDAAGNTARTACFVPPKPK